MFEGFAVVFVQAAQPRSAHAAVDAVNTARLCGVDELVAQLGHALSLPMPGSRGDRAGPRFGSDLSEGWLDLFDHAALFRVNDPSSAIQALQNSAFNPRPALFNPRHALFNLDP